MTGVQPTPGSVPAEDTAPAEDASAQALVPTEGHHEPEAEIKEEVAVSMLVDTMEGTAPAKEASVAPEPERTVELQTHPADDAQTEGLQEPGENHEEGEMDDEETPITLATIPQSVQEPVEEGEIELPVATAPPTAVDSTLSLIDPDRPLAYSDLRILECRRGSSEDELVFEFNIDPKLMASLSRWAGRYKSAEWVRQVVSVCAV